MAGKLLPGPSLKQLTMTGLLRSLATYASEDASSPHPFYLSKCMMSTYFFYRYCHGLI